MIINIRFLYGVIWIRIIVLIFNVNVIRLLSNVVLLLSLNYVLDIVVLLDIVFSFLDKIHLCNKIIISYVFYLLYILYFNKIQNIREFIIKTKPIN
jgi:hypothetical protein